MAYSLLILAAIGFAIAAFIYFKKNRHQELVCILGEDCNKVVNSKYGKTFGVDNTIGGMIYYAFVIVSSIAFLSGVQTPVISLTTIMIIAGIGASLFSIYLAYVQLAILEEWCEWCLASAGITITITIVEIFKWLI